MGENPGKLFISEDTPREDAHRHGYVFSYVDGPADCRPQEFMTRAEAADVYAEVDAAIESALENPGARPQTIYAGVDLLRAHKKKIFEYAYFAATRFLLMRRAAERLKPRSITLERRSDADMPYIADLLEAARVPLPSILWVDAPGFLPSGASRAKTAPFGAGFLGGSAGPWNRAAETAFYSDYAKSRDVIDACGGKAVFFGEYFSGRIWWEATSHGFGYVAAGPAGGSFMRQADVREACRAFAGSASVFAGRTVAGLDLEKVLERKIRRVAENDLAPLLYFIRRTGQFLDDHARLRSALLDEDVSPRKNAFCQVARQRGVKCAVEMHGLLGHKSGFLPLEADAMFVWGEAQKRKLVEWGCPEARVIVSGNSRYERYRKLDAADCKKRVAALASLDPRRPIALVAFTPLAKRRRRLFEHEMKAFYRLMFASFARNEDLQYILKIHPGESAANRADLRQWIDSSSLKGRMTVLEDADPLYLARACDFLIVYRTTYAVDGLALGKPVICVHDSADDSMSEFRPFGVFRYAESIPEMEGHIRSLIGSRFELPLDAWERSMRACLNYGAPEPPREIIARWLTSRERAPQTKTETVIR